MPKHLIIAEKPSVARDIAAALGCKPNQQLHESSTVIVSNAIGHLVEMFTPMAEIKGAPLPIIPAQFELRAVEKTKSQFLLLKKLMLSPEVDTIVNCCDAGREGEAIFRLIYELAGCKKPMTRMWLQSMTQESIIDAYRNMRPGKEFDDLADSARCRAESDWLVGINGSRIISRSRGSNNSAGRVQTPTLAIVVHRDLEIRNFRAKDYFEVHGRFKVADSGTYIGKWQNPNVIDDDPIERCPDLATARSIQEKCQRSHPTSVIEETKPTTKVSPLLFDLTTLQVEANKRFGFSAKATLDLAQALYERHKVLTYPRTDAQALPEDYVETAQKTVKSLSFGSYKPHADRITEKGWVKPIKRIFDNSKISDHFAIIPTGKAPEGLSQAEGQIFDLVAKRFLACFHPSAEYLATERITMVATEQFRSTGRVLKSQGWLAVYGGELDEEDEEKEPSLCKYTPGDVVKTDEIVIKALKTKPPKHYTEATLLRAMETAGKFVEDEALSSALKEKGIGTPATRAGIIETLVCDYATRGGVKEAKEPFIRREKKELISTDKGLNLIQFLEGIKIHALTNPSMTGEWESKLKLMENGKYGRPEFMEGIRDLTRSIVDTIDKSTVLTKMKCVCPRCKSAVVAGPRTVECEAKCGFGLWTVIARRPFTTAELEELIAKGAIQNLSGFISKADKPFSAGLKLNDEFKAEFVFEERPRGDVLKYQCPKCGGSLLSTPKAVNCEADCGFKFWKEVASRSITDNETMILLKQGQIGPLNGFVSGRTGKKFSATLKMNPEFKAEFVF